MSQTKAQRKKQQKSLAHRKDHLRKHNLQMNAPVKRFRLDVFLDGTWRIGIREWTKAFQYEAHREDTESRREKGEEIAPGRVVDIVTGKIVLEIEGSKPKGSAPDKIADGPKAADVDKPIESAETVELPVELPSIPVELSTTAAEEPKKRSKFLRILSGER